MPNNTTRADKFCFIRGKYHNISIACGVPQNYTYAAALKEIEGEFVST
jgi:hypothetical protein